MKARRALKAELRGKRVLVVEDEALVAMLIEDTLADIGCTVVETVRKIPEALALTVQSNCDMVVLDVNLNGQYTSQIAELLKEKRIPFIFCTGYGAAGIPPHLHDVPVLQKPFQQPDLEEALSAALIANATR